MGRTWMFFSGGDGGGEEELQGTTAETFSQDDASSKQPCLCYILYISQWGFRYRACLQAITKGVLDPGLPWTNTFSVRLRQPVDLVHALKTVKGLLLLVPSRTQSESTEQWVFLMFMHMRSIHICYMSLICHGYMSLICYMSVQGYV